MRKAPRSTAAALLVLVAALTACGKTSKEEPGALAAAEVSRCATGDQPESGLQGQVPAALRARGFQGFSCNLKLVGQYPGEGANFSAAVFHDPSGHICAYMSTGATKNIMTGETITRIHPGVAVIDITDPTRPVRSTSLTSPAMLDPWESLRVNPRRQVLAGDAGQNSTEGSSYVDFYDLSGDCRAPQLLSSSTMGGGENGGLELTSSPIGHEGNFAPDGRTYYVGDIVNQTYNAVDITDLTKPRLVAQFNMRGGPLAGDGLNGVSHGLSVSDDGNRAYLVTAGFPSPADLHNPNYRTSDGFYIVDTSEVEERKPNARMPMVSSTAVPGGSMAQHTLVFKAGGKSYLLFVDEGGAVGFPDFPNAADYMKDVQAACAAGLSPFPTPKLYDISDEHHPKLVSQLGLQSSDPHNCAKIEPDIAGLTVFTYGSHYCSVDNRANATAVACANFNSGIRVFDIRDPLHPSEIAYYNPPGTSSAQLGSLHHMAGQWQPGAPDWCTAGIEFDYARKLLTTACMDSGLLVLRFENDVWPMPQSTPSREQQ